MKKADKIANAVIIAEKYLNRISRWTDEQKRLNIRAYADAMNLSAWLSVYKFGNNDASKQAGKIIYTIFGKRK